MEPNNPQAELVKALVQARAEFAAIEKDGANPHLNNRYATLGAVLEAVAAPLMHQGIAVSQTTVPLDGGKWALETTLLHVGGGRLAGVVPLEYGEARGLNPMQALGSAISYARRYGLLTLLCLTAEDDDGASAGMARRPEAARPGAGGGPPAKGPGRPDPTPEELRERQESAMRRLHAHPPKDGRQLFRLVMDLDPAKDLLNAVNAYGKRNHWGPKLVEWSEPHVMEAVRFLRDEMEAQAVADRELS